MKSSGFIETGDRLGSAARIWGENLVTLELCIFLGLADHDELRIFIN